MVHLYEAENDKGSEGLQYLLKEAPRRLLIFHASNMALIQRIVQTTVL